MPEPVDPASLDGEALTQWYTRSPDEIEQARQQAYARRYNAFFNPPQPDPDRGFSRGPRTPSVDIDPGFSRGMGGPTKDIDPGFSWAQVGPSKWRSVAASADGLAPLAISPDASPNDGAVLDKGLAGPDDGAEIIDVGNPANPRLRREWEIKHGQAWPKDAATGRNHDVAHIVARADGGTDTLDNIRPLHPDLHRQEHMQNGDFKRWGARAAAPRAVGPGFEPIMRGLGLLQIIPDITGVLSGRIRTDTPLHFWSDMAGVPSPDDPPPGNLIA